MEAKITKLRKWCEDNYSNGADTMVECWGISDYEDLLNSNNGDYKKSLKVLKGVASVYLDRQHDAENCW